MRNEPEDSELEEELRQLADSWDPVPPELLQAAADAFAWRDIDSALAELVFDSLLDEDAAALVRSSQQRRLVTFRTSELTIDLEVTSTGSSRTVIGQIAPPQRAAVEIRGLPGTVTVEADDLGRFQSGPLQAGPMSLRLSPAAGTPLAPVVTDWVSI